MASMVALSVVPCFHVGYFAGCGLVSGGATEGSASGVEQSRPSVTPWLALGARAQLELALGAVVSVRAAVDLLVPLVRTRLLIGQEEAFVTGALAGALGVFIVLAIP